jgi:hypothetical protein
MNQRHAGYMPDAPQWDGKIFRPAKAGKGFRWETADGAQRRAQIRKRRARYSEARHEAEFEDAMLATRPWHVKVTATITECLLWPFKMLGLYSD